jgi:hypothetical protein
MEKGSVKFLVISNPCGEIHCPTSELNDEE